MESIQSVIDTERDVFTVSNPSSRLSDEIVHFKYMETTVRGIVYRE